MFGRLPGVTAKARVAASLWAWSVQKLPSDTTGTRRITQGSPQKDLMSDSSSGQTPPPESLIDYPQLVDRALRQVVRLALEQVSGGELPGQHYFYISFSTVYPGVEMDADLLAEHPETLSIVLQYQFENLIVGSDHFEVTLYFGGMPKHLVVPYDAVLGFVDPFISFALQFPPLGEEGQDEDQDGALDYTSDSPGGRPSYLRALSGEGDEADEGQDQEGQDDAQPATKPAAKKAPKSGAKAGTKAGTKSGSNSAPKTGATIDQTRPEAQAAGDAEDGSDPDDGDDDGSNVVSLDQFRKK